MAELLLHHKTATTIVFKF